MRFIPTYKLVITSLLFAICLSLNGQRPVSFNKAFQYDAQARFIRLSTDDGLSNNRVLDILQDKNGFIWIATRDGLNKYDGDRFEIFKHQEGDSLGLSSNLISSIMEDRDGNLFVGTDEGLFKYNKDKNNFTRIRLEAEGFAKSKPYIRKITEGPNGVMWIAEVDGYILKYNSRNKSIEAIYKHRPINQPYYHYHPIYYDSDSILWVGGRNIDVTYLDEDSNKLHPIAADGNDLNKKRENDVACYYEDSRSVFWVSALDGIYTFDKHTEVFKKFLGVSTWDILEAKNGMIWFASGSGVYQYDPVDTVITAYVHQKDNPASLSSNSVHKVFEDSRGNLWFGTSKGINIYAPPELPFGPYSHLPGVRNSPEGSVVTAAYEDAQNNLWIGYQNSGLDYFDRRANWFTHYKKENSGLASNNVSALYIDKEDRLWIGLWQGIGFNLLNQRTKQFDLFTLDPFSQRVDWYGDFVEDDYGQFYIGFWGANGLTLFDRSTATFGANFTKRFSRAYVSRLITRLFKDKDNCIWVATTAGGLHRYFPGIDSTASYFADDSISCGLTSNGINDITQDADGNIWLVSNTLQKYVPESDSFISFSNTHGLESTHLVSLLADDYGHLWIATQYEGLFRFNIEKMTFKHFREEDGLQSNSFNNARFKLESGELFFGGQNGFNLFDPSEIHWQNSLPKASFGRLYVFDEIREYDLNEVQFVNLAPGENVFTIELGSYDRVLPQKYIYQCKLEGYDEEWITLDSRERSRRFAGVQPGQYTFFYRIGNKDGLWYRQSLKIMINLQTPFYQTWWFISFSILVLLVTIYIIIERRTYSLHQKQRSLELQQKLFRLQMNPHFMFNSLLAIQNFIFMHNAKEAGNYLSDFARLFRLILDNSRVEFVPMEKELETLELYLKLQKLRYQDKFEYSLILDEDIDIELIQIPPMLAQPMIENALEHGLFHKHEKGHIWVRFKLDKDTLIFEVEDDGVGLEKSKKLKPASKDHKSSALDITRERIKILGKKHKYFVVFELKELKDDDQKAKGTMVRFNIPYMPFAFDENPEL